MSAGRGSIRLSGASGGWDFQTGYFRKLLTAPVSVGAVMLGRLLGDCVRLAVIAALVLVLAVALGAQVQTGGSGRAADDRDGHDARDRHLQRAERQSGCSHAGRRGGAGGPTTWGSADISPQRPP